MARKDAANVGEGGSPAMAAAAHVGRMGDVCRRHQHHLVPVQPRRVVDEQQHVLRRRDDAVAVVRDRPLQVGRVHRRGGHDVHSRRRVGAGVPAQLRRHVRVEVPVPVADDVELDEGQVLPPRGHSSLAKLPSAGHRRSAVASGL